MKKTLIPMNEKTHTILKNRVKEHNTTLPVFVNRVLERALRDERIMVDLVCAPARKRGPKKGSKRDIPQVVVA